MVCALTLVAGFVLHIVCKSKNQGKVGVEHDHDDNDDGFKKGISKEEQSVTKVEFLE